MTSLFALIFGYLLGSIPFGLLLTAASGRGDIRKIGSGNIGATNVLRTGSKTLAAATLLLDALKGAAAVLVAAAWADRDAALLAGFGSVLGHLFPVWLGFKGGKGVATAFGVLFAACWPVGIVAGIVWLLVAKFARISSLASLSALAVAPIAAIFLADGDTVKLLFIVAVLVYARHHANIRRLLSGTEPTIGQGASHAEQT